MFFILLATAAIGIVLHLAFDRQACTAKRILEVILLWLLAVVVGVGGITAFAAHAFFADWTAAAIGWPAGNPFQFEVAVTDLAFGILGLLCIWLRGGFWTAVIIGESIFFWGCAYGHVRQYLLAHNMAPGNVGPALAVDVAMPLVLIALLIAHHAALRKKTIA